MSKDINVEKYVKENKKYEYLSVSSLDTMKDVNDYASKCLNGITSMRDKYLKMCKEPIIAKTVIQMCDSGEIREYYTSYGVCSILGKNIVTRDAPLGAIRSYHIGRTYEFGKHIKFPIVNGKKHKDEGKKFIVIQNSLFLGISMKNGLWECTNTVYCDYENRGDKTISSLRAFYKKNVKKEICIENNDFNFDAWIDQIDNETQKKNAIKKGRIHDTLSALGLRVIHTLDSNQDELARRDLINNSVFIAGPAGSGKSTTLIHRVRLKINKEYGITDDNEKRIIEEIEGEGKRHDQSWIMFTPTTLLKQFLKEAFGREGVPVTDDNISTWDDFVIPLGREFNLLRGAGKPGFNYDDEMDHFVSATTDRCDVYFDFYQWCIKKYTSEVYLSLDGIVSLDFGEEMFDLIDNINNISNRCLKYNNIVDFLSRLIELKNDIIKKNNSIKNRVNTIVKEELKKLASNPENLKIFEKINDDNDDNNNNYENLIYDDDVSIIKLYKKIIVAYASNKYSGKEITKKEKELIMLLGDGRMPSDETLLAINNLKVQQEYFSIFYDPIRSFFKKIRSFYEEFRAERIAAKKWYSSTVQNGVIDSNELDILILYNLQIAYNFLSVSKIYHNIDDSWIKILKDKMYLYYNQVLVDEAPDFSPLQLKCMRLLSHFKIKSFFACGDFYQRTNTKGTINFNELKNFFGNSMHISLEKIGISYRQNKYLFDFSQKILSILNEQYEFESEKSAEFANAGYHPVLVENCTDTDLSEWLALRICEIEKEMGKELPTIGILVPTEDDVDPVAKSLKRTLKNKTSVIVQACHNGENVGIGHAVRVFDIQHIKGLEFEAVFFVAFDKLSQIYPDIYGNFLYVGATRAANFLGVTCEKTLPSEMNILKDYFTSNWEGNDDALEENS